MGNTIDVQNLKKQLAEKKAVREKLQQCFDQTIGQITLLEDLIKQAEKKEIKVEPK